MSTIAMINNNCNGQKTKHIEIRFSMTREQVKLIKIALHHLPTQDMTRYDYNDRVRGADIVY